MNQLKRTNNLKINQVSWIKYLSKVICIEILQVAHTMLWSLSAITATKEEHILISQGWIQDWTRKRCVPTPGFQSCSCQLARHTSASWIVVSKFNLTSFSIIVLFIYLYKRTLWCYYFYPVKYSENFQVLLQSYNNNLFFEGKNNFF